MSGQQIIPYLEEKIREGVQILPSDAKYRDIHAVGLAASHYMKSGKKPLRLILEDLRRDRDAAAKRTDVYSIEKARRYTRLIELAERQGMLNGDVDIVYEKAKPMYDEMVKKTAISNPEIADIIQRLDKTRDHALIANLLFSFDPEIRKKVQVEKLYRLVLNVGAAERRGHASHQSKDKARYSETRAVKPFSENLERILKNIPYEKVSGNAPEAAMLRAALDRKADDEVFSLFYEDKKQAFQALELQILEEKVPALREAYTRAHARYQGYDAMEISGNNTNFRDPETGEVGVFPSIHQKIALWHLQKEKRFGVFDACGTGKTGIGTLGIQLIKEELKKEGKKFRRAVIVCPNNAKDTWRRGLAGGAHERYLAEKQDICIINGEQKTSKFMQELAAKEIIVINEDQLITRVPGTKKFFYEALIELGADYVALDESHHFKSSLDKTLIKKRDDETMSGGGPTESFAARQLAASAEYLCLLSGTPIPDNLDDYAVPYSMLNPETCKHPQEFKKLYEENARLLHLCFLQKTVRRTAQDLNRDLEWKEVDVNCKLGTVQRQLYSHIVKNVNRNDWLIQARKCLVDPRLVDPEIIREAGLFGKIGIEHSAKYQKLMRILTSPGGPVARGESFVVFSSMFREGVMCGDEGKERGHAGLKERYATLDLLEEYHRLGLDTTLDTLINESLQKKFGKKCKIGVIDGTVQDIGIREERIRQLGKSLNGLLVTADAGGESASYTAANWAFILDEDFSPRTGEQIIARELRKGQKKYVRIAHLMARNTLEQKLSKYVERKRMIISIAQDGCELNEEEEEFIRDKEGKHLALSIRCGNGGLGGESIDVYDGEMESIHDFQTILRRRGAARVLRSGKQSAEGVTDAQEVMQLIGRDKVNCWKNPEFVELYLKALPSLSVPVVHRAKLCNLLQRAQAGEIEFPRLVLSEGAGPSLLYDAYHVLSPFIQSSGYAVPRIVDRDFSLPMLTRGKNPYRILGEMTGKNSTLKDGVAPLINTEALSFLEGLLGTDNAFRNGVFDMVDNESISLLRNEGEVKAALLEAQRILKSRGTIELIVQNMRFKNDFYRGMEQLGFEVVSARDEGFAVSKQLRQRLREEFDEHFAEAYAHKLAATHLIVARKEDKPQENVPEKLFWFETLGTEEKVVQELPRGERIDDAPFVEDHNGPENNGKSEKKLPAPAYAPDIESAAREIEQASKGRGKASGSGKHKGKKLRRVLPDDIPNLRVKNRRIQEER